MQRFAAIFCVIACACGEPRAGRGGPEGASNHAQPPFVGKVWIATDTSAAPGTLRIFLSDGTLVMDSCWETYRLAEWQAIDDRRIEWREDSARIEAEVAQKDKDHLRLRLHLASETREEIYRLAETPYVCPDMPR